jgi:Domain of unknown function (DUF4411)
MAGRVFVLDANVFIQAHRRYYAFDLAPKFWTGLVQHAEGGQVESIDRVKSELEKGKDELAAWAGGDFASAFASTDEESVIRAYGNIMNWVSQQGQFSDAAKAEFAQGADGWLVAYAQAKGHVVVTHEVLDLNVRKRVPIPNICQALRVAWVDTFAMMRELGLRWS